MHREVRFLTDQGFQCRGTLSGAVWPPVPAAPSPLPPPEYRSGAREHPRSLCGPGVWPSRTRPLTQTFFLTSPPQRGALIHFTALSPPSKEWFRSPPLQSPALTQPPGHGRKGHSRGTLHTLSPPQPLLPSAGNPQSHREVDSQESAASPKPQSNV